MGVLLLFAFVFYGCNKISEKVVGSTENFFKALESYEASVRVTFLKDRQPNEIKMKQSAKMSGIYEMTVVEPAHLKDTKISYNGQKIVEYYPGLEKTIVGKGSAVQNEILLTSFIKRYLTNENIKEQELQLNGKKMITFEIPIEGNFKYLSKEKLWLDAQNQTPIQMVIYDEEGNVSIEVVYEDFKMNA